MTLGGIVEESSWVEKKYVIHLPKTIEAILDTIRQVLNQGKTQKIVIEKGRPISYSSYVKAGEESNLIGTVVDEDVSSLSLGEVARGVSLTEVVLTKGRGSLIDLIKEVTANGLFLTHIAVGEETVFWDWLGIISVAEQNMVKQMGFAGAIFSQDVDIPETAIILYGSSERSADVYKIQKAFLGHMHTEVGSESRSSEELSERNKLLGAVAVKEGE